MSLSRIKSLFSFQMFHMILKESRRFSYYWLGLLIFSACSNPFGAGADVYETAYIRSNGSGRFEIAIDLNKARKFINIARYFNRDPAACTQTTVHKAFRKTAKRLKRVPGIKKIATARDANMLNFKLSFEFSSIKALNRAMRKIDAHVDQQRLTYFKMNSRSFVRIDTRSITKLIAYLQSHDDSSVTSFDLETFFKNSTYQFAYSFDKTIKRTTNKLASITSNRKTVILKQHIFDEQERRLSFSNKVVF